MRNIQHPNSLYHIISAWTFESQEMGGQHNSNWMLQSDCRFLMLCHIIHFELGKEEGQLEDPCSSSCLLFAPLQIAEVWPTRLLHKPHQLLFVPYLSDVIYTGHP